MGLLQGDVETVRQWQSQFGRFIFAWLYYQLNKDEAQAATLTGQSLSQALKELPTFDPQQTTMYLWLKGIASQQLQAALARWQIKPQRPWAWSEMPPNVLDSLKRFRTEPLIPEVAGCVAVIEMVQTTLADLSEQDRDLLIGRYMRLDSIEQLASERNYSTEKVNQQLYLARHAFRRGFFCLIQSVSPDFSEPTVSGGVELFESNLELLLRSVNASPTISSDYTQQIKQTVLLTASEIAQNPPVLKGTSPRKKLMMAIAGVGILIIAVAVFVSVGPKTSPIAPPATSAPAAQVVSPAEKQDAQIDAAALKRVMDMGNREDIAGLLKVLQSDSFILQMTAAHYLGQLADESAIEPLEKSMARWYPDGSEDNPFFSAIFAIENRLAEAQIKEPVALPSDPQPPPKPTAPKETVKPILLTGHIKAYDGSPLSGVQVSLQKELPLQEQVVTVPQKLASTTTNEEGLYRFDTLPEGSFVIAVHDPKRQLADSSRLVWPAKDKLCTVDFGGPISVAGTLSVDGHLLAEQTVLLSDQFKNPTQGIFTAEMETDAYGGFLFTGVPSGEYGLFTQFTTNRWTMMEKIEVGISDQTAFINQPTVDLIVQADRLPAMMQIVSVSLRYSPDSSETLAMWTGIKTADDKVFEINNVLPGNYTLCVDFSNRVQTLRDIAVTTEPQQNILVTYAPFGTAGLSGRFLSSWPEGLVMTCTEPPLRINLMPEETDGYVLGNLPPAVYTIGCIVNQTFVSYLEMGLMDGQPAKFDLDPQALAKTRSPLYVYVTDAQGCGLADGQIWLAGETGVFIAEPIGRVFFAAVPPGQYILYATFAGYSAYEQTIIAPPSEVRATPSSKNTTVVRLSK